ncbi:type 2 periplasmic-binding domain-containing protein [Algicola sagamiensis]|uniref:hypothetical protein n=1 Tax=Algicola sagamiensis TaxID=163869 RepID=UPI000366F6CB|nr:hypothetical protein [Algicola sagamiensis]
MTLGHFSASISALTVIKHKKPESETDLRPRYFIQLLEQALEVTRKDFGVYRIEQHDIHMYQGRALKLLETGRLDIVWTMTSIAREKQVEPIRIPLMKGLLGKRMMLIHKDKLRDFSQIQTLDELKKLSIYQGHDWPDLKILRMNGFNAHAISDYLAMFKLLNKGKYDLFPRGMLEISSEIQPSVYANIVLLPNIYVSYPTAVYFFIHPSRKRLYQRIETGLKRLDKSGDFDRLLNCFPLHIQALKDYSSQSIQEFILPNPIAPDGLPEANSPWWYQRGVFDFKQCQVTKK